jgi:hypothetical protein
MVDAPAGHLDERHEDRVQRRGAQAHCAHARALAACAAIAAARATTCTPPEWVMATSNNQVMRCGKQGSAVVPRRNAAGPGEGSIGWGWLDGGCNRHPGCRRQHDARPAEGCCGVTCFAVSMRGHTRAWCAAPCSCCCCACACCVVRSLPVPGCACVRGAPGAWSHTCCLVCACDCLPLDVVWLASL